MDNSCPNKTPMVVHSLEIGREINLDHGILGKRCLGLEIPYLSVIGALMYLANCSRPDIIFAVNYLLGIVWAQLGVIGWERSVFLDTLMAQGILFYSSRKIMIPV
jgi:hypothetical protein